MDNNDRRNSRNSGGREPKNRNSLLVFLVLTAVVLMSMYFMRNIQQGAMEQEVTYTEFEEMVKAGEVESVVIASDRIEIYRKASEETSLEMPFGFDVSQVSYYTGLFPDYDLKALLDEYDVDYTTEVPDNTGATIYNILNFALLAGMLVFLYMFVMGRMSKGGGIMGVGKSRAKVYMQKETGVTFKDVAGQDEAKESLQEVVDFLHNPGKYTKIGAKLPRAPFWWGLPGRARRFWPRLWQGRPMCRFSPCPVRSLWRCSWAWARPG